jgi:hypothetical protein
MPAHPKSSHLSLPPEDRRRQVAAIFARGILRLKAARANAAVGPPESRPEYSDGGLEVPAEPRLTVVRGTTG